MGATTRTVGGGGATGVSNDWNSFLQSQLTGQSTGAINQLNQLSQTREGIRAGGGNTSTIDAQIAALQQGNPGQSQRLDPSFINHNGGNGPPVSFGDPTQSGQAIEGGNGSFQDAFHNMLAGRVNDTSGAGNALSNFFHNPTQFGNTYTAPTYNPASTTSLDTNVGSGMNGMANLSGVGGTPQSSFNAVGANGLTNPSSDFTSTLANFFKNGTSSIAGLNGSGGGASGYNPASIGSGVALDPAANFDFNSPVVQANAASANRQLDQSSADLRARFGASGAGSLGTGAQFAESNMRAAAAPELIRANAQVANEFNANDLANRTARANVGLGSRGQDANVALGNMQGGIQGAQNTNQYGIAQMTAGVNNLGNLLQSSSNARSADLSTGLGVRGQNIDQNSNLNSINAGTANSNVNAGVAGRGQDLNSLIQNMGLGNSFFSNNAAQNASNRQTNNSNSMTNSNFGNLFNQNNASNTATFGQSANSLNANTLAQMIQSGIQQNGMGNNNIQNILSQMFGSFQQSNGLGTPQAQTIQQPSQTGQIVNLLSGLLGSYFGGGGGR